MDRRITLVNPPYEHIAPGYEFVRHGTNRSPSLGWLHLASVAREHGWTPLILGSDAQAFGEPAVVGKVIERAPSVMSITLFTVGVWSAINIARGIKRALPEVTIVVGGPHICSMGRETMERFLDFDFAVDGEGEWALTELLAALESDGDPADVRRVAIYGGKLTGHRATALEVLERLKAALPPRAQGGHGDAALSGAR
jgi:radical SAM superfamily enzyme YgiQ (UPF0313 family)